jgi:hypothetical protein
MSPLSPVEKGRDHDDLGPLDGGQLVASHADPDPPQEPVDHALLFVDLKIGGGGTTVAAGAAVGSVLLLLLIVALLAAVGVARGGRRVRALEV